MSFAAAVDALHTLGQELAPTAPRRKFELEHMRILARALGDPQTQFPAVLIAGTNGKGSTASTLAAILTAAGLRTGLYTSPHLTRITERIRLSSGERTTENGQSLAEISEDDFARLYFRVDDAARALVSEGKLPHHPSYFETLTGLAFLYFAEQRADIAVLEVGMGGRLDATNIVEPLVSVITDIDLDHQDYLGHTVTAIAREKAGILRRNGTLVTLPQHPEANQAIGEVATELDVRGVSAVEFLPDVVRSHAATAPPVSRDIGNRALDNEQSRPGAPSKLRLGGPEGNHYDLHVGGQLLRVRSPLAGEHQRRNIALAIAAAFELLRNPSLAAASNLEPRTSNLIPAIEAGIAATSWPGRLEFLPPNLLLDVAHNPAGAWTLRAAIASLPEVAPGFSLGSPRTLIFSCLRDKDLTQMARILFPLFDPTAGRPRDAIVLAPVDSLRAAPLEDLEAAAAALDIPAHPAADPAAALALARELTPSNGIILATGSIYLVGALRALATS